MRSFLPSSRGSLRVATTVPTTRARIMECPVRLACVRGLGFADGQHVFQALVGPRDYVDGNQLAYTAGGGGAGIGGGPHGGHIATYQGGHVAGADLLPAHERHLRGLYHSIGGFNYGYQAACLDHS